MRFLFDVPQPEEEDVMLTTRLGAGVGSPPLFRRRNCSVFEEITVWIFPTACYFPAEAKGRGGGIQKWADSWLLAATFFTLTSTSGVLPSRRHETGGGMETLPQIPDGCFQLLRFISAL